MTLNFNFLNSLRYWHEGLSKIAYHLPEMDSHFRDSLAPNNMEAGIWLVEKLKPVIEEESLRSKGLHVLILNSWLGIPLVPLLCENLDIATFDMVEMDGRANELSRIFHKHYIQEKFINFHYHTLDAPFAISTLNMIKADVVINMNCEQMYPLTDLKVANPFAIYAMQSSNVTEEMLGINCVSSAAELSTQLGLAKIHSAEKKLQEMYTWEGRKFFERYQVIGTK